MTHSMYDYIIIGSGASGGVMAYRLTQAGAKCLVLEAGKDLGPKTYSPNEMRANARLMWGGGSDFTSDNRTVLLRGKVVGGGTIVNQCLLDRFDDVALDDWADRSGIKAFSVDGMTPYYERAESIVQLHKYEKNEWNRNAELYAKSFDDCGYEWSPLRRGESNCGGLNEDGKGRKNDCIVCLGGCPRKSKQSSAVQSLARARALGAELMDEFDVGGVVDGRSHVAVHGKRRGEAHTLYAKQVVMAAGALGTTKLLMKSGYLDKHKALGQGFYCHPQFMSIGFLDEPVDSHKGALQSLKSTDPRFRQQGFKLENVFAGPIAIAMLNNQFGIEHHEFMRKYRHMASIEVATRDEVPGTVRLANNGRLIVDKKVTGPDARKVQQGNRVVKELLVSMGAQNIMQSPMQIGLHLMGGCAIGENASKSVVRPDFRMYGSDNIIIADGSVFPSAPGINPSLSIMAMSHMAADKVLADAGVAGNTLTEARAGKAQKTRKTKLKEAS